MQQLKNFVDQAVRTNPAGATDAAAAAERSPVTLTPYAPVTLSELDTDWHPRVAEAVDLARDWQRRKRKQANASLVLVARGIEGDVDRTGYGCGKTHIALACLWSICYTADGQPFLPVGKFYLANDVVSRRHDEPISTLLRPKAYLAQQDEETYELMAEHPPVVVIDDVGTEERIVYVASANQDAARQARYYELVNHCYTHGISLIITANMPLDQLAQHIGGRAWSRLLEMAPSGFMLDMSGVPDYRRKVGGR